MKNKGFTLIEVIVVIGLLAVATIVISSSLVSMNNKQKQSEYERIVEKIKTATNTYVGLNINEIKDNVKISGEENITLDDLVKEGLIDEDLIDPRGNKEIPLTNIVIVTYDSTSLEFSYEYNYE